jgi:hypothetical protein
VQADNATFQTTGTGNISLTGKGGNGSFAIMFGVYLLNGTSVSSTATGTSAGTITIDGTGGNGTTNNHGVYIRLNTTDVTSVDGAIQITGIGNGSGSGGIGVFLDAIETIASTGTATITINGTGGPSFDTTGVVLLAIPTNVTSANGDIQIIGRGNGNGSGVELASDAVAQVTSGLLTVTGTGGAGNSVGVRLSELSGGQLRSIGSGGIVVTAVGSGTSADLLAGGNSLIGGANASGPITLNANSIDFRSTLKVQSSDELTIKPRTANTTIGLGNITPGTLNLTSTELGFLTDGFSSITIGDTAAGTGTVNIRTVTFLDPVTIAGGTINDNPGTDIIAPSATLKGNVSPGLAGAAGILNVTGDFAFANGSSYTVQIGGTSPGTSSTNHDQIDVVGTVTIGTSVTLSAIQFSGFVPATNNTFTIIKNDGTDAVVGTFASLPEGATISNFLGSGVDARITYAGGDGNDVVLIFNRAPASPVDNDANANQVDEGAAIGTAVGITALSTDPDGDTVTYSLTNNAGGRFAINPSSGVVTVANGSLLDGPASHTITVRADDGKGAPPVRISASR